MFTQNHYLNHILGGIRQQELLDVAARERETRSLFRDDQAIYEYGERARSGRLLALLTLIILLLPALTYVF